jgi:sugar lactone lactonase YvrE
MIKLYYKRILSMGIALVAARGVHAQYWTNGQAASYVIGQPGFGSSTAAVTSTGLSVPYSMVVDPASGKVFVADRDNNRVLRYPSTAVMTNGAAAEAVLGQTNFTSNTTGTTATTLNSPNSVAIDASGNLWVVDGNNSRVLRYADAANIASGSAASGVLGQPNFVSGSTVAASAGTLYYPNDVFCKGTTIWVSDTENNRILRFNNAASKANGGSADGVLGQPNFTGSASGLTATSIYWPLQIYVDEYDNLWELDGLNNRVLMFPDASTAANGEAATKVLGQTSMTTSVSGRSASLIGAAWGVYGDGAGNIYVSDVEYNNRIMVFVNAASLSSGGAATYLLGQPNFTSDGPGDGARQLDGPQKLFANTSLLAVADVANNRMSIFTPLIPLPLLLTGFAGRLQGNGEVLLQWQVSGGGDPGAPGPAWLDNPGTTQLQYSTTDTIGFTDVLNTQSVDPAVSNYSYVQVSPATGPNYYRVKLTMPDGSASYSQVVTVTVGGGLFSKALGIYPTPATSSVVVALPSTGDAVIKVYNPAGGLMQRVVTAAAVQTMNVGGWAAGVYIVRVRQGGMSTTGSFVKEN